MRAAKAVWIGRILSGLGIAFMAMDTAVKFLPDNPNVRQAIEPLGLPIEQLALIGFLSLACLILYVVPRTAVLGVILYTGYLGGAVALHVRVGNPLLSHELVPVYVAALLWGGLYLREPRLRAIVPWRT